MFEVLIIPDGIETFPLLINVCEKSSINVEINGFLSSTGSIE
jgi:hypothetical protein